MSLHVLNPKDVRASIEEDLKNKTQTTFLIDMKEPPKGKEYKCPFLTHKIKIPKNDRAQGAILRMGDINVYAKDPANAPSASFIEITKGPDDPTKIAEDEDDDPRAKGKNTKGDKEKPRKPTVSTTISKSGDFGFCIDHFDRAWVARIDELRKEEKITEMKTNPLIQRKISAKNKDLDKEGKPLRNRPIQDPIIRMTIDFDKYPEDYFLKFQAGHQKTEILDFNQPYKDAMGRLQFRPAMFKEKIETDGVITEKTSPVGPDNVHRYLRRGCRIVDGRFHFDSGTESNYGVSVYKLAGKIVVDTSYSVDELGGETPAEVDDDALAAIMARVEKTAHGAHAVVPAQQVAKPPGPTDEDDAVARLIASVGQ